RPAASRLRFSPSGAAFFRPDGVPPFPETIGLIGENLACRRGERLVFAGIDCRIGTGDALVLIGPNGSGKSSLLRLLATLLAPATGRLLWDGTPVEDDPAGYRARSEEHTSELQSLAY